MCSSPMYPVVEKDHQKTMSSINVWASATADEKYV
jgi:hypothetical protein